MLKKILFTITAGCISIAAFAQGNVETRMLDYDPDKFKILPDKFFELGIPLLFAFLLFNTIVTIFKNRAEHQLKIKMVEKGVADEALVKIFKESNAIARLQPLKWFLFCMAIALSSLIIHLLRNYLMAQGGYLAAGILLMFIAVAFFIYYNILSKKQ